MMSSIFFLIFLTIYVSSTEIGINHQDFSTAATDNSDPSSGTTIELSEPNGIIYSNLNFPSGITVDRQNYIYIANTQGNNIVKIDSSGNLIGTYDSISPWLYPASIAIDTTGNMYIAYNNNNNKQIVQTDSSGNFLSVFSTNNPRDVVVDASGIYVADGTNASIFKLAKNQYFVADLASPNGMKLDIEGNIYIADSNNNRIVKLNYTGQIINSYTTTNPSLNFPSDVALDQWNNIYVTDTGNSRVIKMSPSGQQLASYTTDLPNPVSLFVDASGIYVTNSGQINSAVKISFAQNFTASSTLNQPSGMAVDSFGQLYILDYGNNRVVKLDLDGNELVSFGLGSKLKISGICVDELDSIYLSDTSDNMILKYDSNGNLIQTFNTNSPGAIAADKSGLYVINLYNTISKIGFTGYLRRDLKRSYLATDSLGNLFVFSSNYNTPSTIYKLNPAGRILSQFNTRTYDFTADIAADSSGYVYCISGSYITKYASNGVINATYTSSGLQSGSAIVVGASGNIYILDQSQALIVKFDSSGSQVNIFYIGYDYQYDCGYFGLDKLENLYVACLSWQQIIKMNGTDGTIIGKFSVEEPYIITVDLEGNFYINDDYATAMLKYDMNGNYLNSYPYPNPNNAVSSVAIDVTGIYVTSYYMDIVKINFNRTFNINPSDFLTSISVDQDQNVYVLNNNQIVKFDTTGNIVGYFSDPYVYNPSSMGVDMYGFMYLVDKYSGTIVKIDPSGNQAAMWHEIGIGNPIDIVAKPSGIYITDETNNIILKIPMSQIFMPKSTLASPSGITVDTNGSIYIVDSIRDHIVKLDYDGNQIGLFKAFLNDSSNIIFQDGLLYIADTGNVRIVILDSITGNTIWISNSSLNISQPKSVAIDQTGMYIVDGINNRLLKVGYNQNYTGQGILAFPIGIAVDLSQFIYVADTNLKQVIKLDRFGRIVQTFNLLTTYALGAVTVDVNYNIYVTILRDNRLVIFNQQGFVTFNSTISSFSNPLGIAINFDGTIGYVANSGTNTVADIEI